MHCRNVEWYYGYDTDELVVHSGGAYNTEEAVEAVQEQTNITNESAQAIQAATDIIAGIANQDQPAVIKCQHCAARAGRSGQRLRSRSGRDPWYEH